MGVQLGADEEVCFYAHKDGMTETAAIAWLKGHAGHPENERCDRLAVEAYSRPGLPPDTGYDETKEPTLI